jgi:hypothetical protein
MFGDRASPPLAGERPIDYRRRLAARFQKHSERFKETRFDTMDPNTLGVMEDLIYADAVAAAKAPGGASTPGQLIPIQERDSAGRMITRFVGDIGAFMAPFTSPGATVRVNTTPPKES